VLAFYEGRIIADGDPSAVLDDPEVRKYVTGDAGHAPKGGRRAAH
jgi:branched-chain amino acid transport system ATP-binding protein